MSRSTGRKFRNTVQQPNNSRMVMKIISDENIPDTVNYRDVIGELRGQFLTVAEGKSKILHRKRVTSMSGTLDVMGAISEEDKIGVVKSYFYGRNIDFLVSLFSTETSEILLAITGKNSQESELPPLPALPLIFSQGRIRDCWHALELVSSL